MRSESGEPVEAQGLRLTHEFFRVFRVTPVLGRAFTAEDEIDGRSSRRDSEPRILAAAVRRFSRRIGSASSSTTVVTQVALAIILLVGAGLFIGSFVKLMRIDSTSFDYSNVLVVNVGIRVTPGPDMRAAFAAAEKRGRSRLADARCREGRARRRRCDRCQRRAAAHRQLDPDRRRDCPAG